MTVRLTIAQVSALGQIKANNNLPYPPEARDKATFRALAKAGYCREVTGTFLGLRVTGYELTEKGRDFLNGRRV